MNIQSSILFLLAGIFAMFPFGTSFAREGDRVNMQHIPDSPFVGDAPARTGRSIIFGYKKSEDSRKTVASISAVDTDLKIVGFYVAKYGKDQADIMEYSNGKKRERWIIKNVIYSRSDNYINGEFIMADLSAGSKSFQNGRVARFPKNLLGDIMYYKANDTIEGTRGYLYVLEAGITQNHVHADACCSGIDLSKGPVKAWIDIQSNLPVALEVGECLLKYKYQSNSKFPTPSAEITAAIKNMQKMQLNSQPTVDVVKGRTTN